MKSKLKIFKSLVKPINLNMSGKPREEDIIARTEAGAVNKCNLMRVQLMKVLSVEEFPLPVFPPVKKESYKIYKSELTGKTYKIPKR